MNRDERNGEVFRRIFPLALAALEKIDELPEQINRAIGLLFPLSVFIQPTESFFCSVPRLASENGADFSRTTEKLKGKKDKSAPNVSDVPGEEITPRRFCEAIFEKLSGLEAGGERDYLTRLLATEAFRYALWTEEELETRIGLIGDEEEKQAAYYAWGKFAAGANQRQIAERCAERLDDLACYEKVVRRILVAAANAVSNAPANAPANAADDSVAHLAHDLALDATIESAEGRFRRAIDRTVCAIQTNNAENNDEIDALIASAGEILTQIEESELRDVLLAGAWERLSGVAFDRLEPLADRFDSARNALDAFERYDFGRFGAEISPAEAFIPAERLAVSRRMEQALESLRAESLLPSSRIAALASAARFFYRIGEKNRARDAVRESLELVKRVSNRVERTNVYQALWPILADAGEKSALSRILTALENATDEIEPDDLRWLLWRENLLRALDRGEKESFERFLPKVSVIDRAVFTASALLRWGDADPDAIFAALEPLLPIPLEFFRDAAKNSPASPRKTGDGVEKAPSRQYENTEPLEQAAGLIKIARCSAVCTLENRAKQRIM